MVALGIWWRAQLARRWFSLLVLTLFAGVAAAVPTAAAAGARRADSSLDRMVTAFRLSEVVVDQNGGSAFGGVPDVAMEEVAALGTLADVSIVDIALMRPVGSDFGMLFEFQVRAPRDDTYGRAVDRFDILVGRAPDPTVADEVVVDEGVAALFGLGPGDRLELESWTNDSRDQIGLTEGDVDPDPDGPLIDTRVVGIYRDRQALLTEFGPPSITVTPRFAQEYVGDSPGRAGLFPGVLLGRFADGVNFESFRMQLEEIEARYEGSFFLERSGDVTGPALDAKNAQVLALQLFALVAAIAAFTIMSLSLSRRLQARRSEDEVLRMMGLSPRARIGASLLLGLPVGLGAAVIVALGAWLGSAALPMGIAGRAEPDPGRDFDALVVLTGALLTAGLVLSTSAAIGWMMTRSRGHVSPRRHPTRLARRAAFVPTAGIGIRMAVDGGHGARAVPVRATLIGAVVGIGGVCAALVFNHSLRHLVDTPSLYGWGADAYTSIGPDRDGFDEFVSTLAGTDDIASFSPGIDVELPVPAWATERNLYGSSFDPGHPSMHAFLAGRAPLGANEISIGPDLAASWNVGLGDVVELVGVDGAPAATTVVGISLGPEISFDETYRNGFLLSLDGAARLRAVLPEEGEDGAYVGALVDFVDGRESAGLAALEDHGYLTLAPTTPRQIANLVEVERFPIAIAGFLGILATGFLVHAVVASIRLRRREFAILKVIGFRSAQVRAIIVWHSTTIIVIGAVLGLPLGLLVGRSLFIILADALDVAIQVVVPTPLLAMAGLIGLVLSNIVALGPAFRAGRIRPSDVLARE